MIRHLAAFVLLALLGHSAMAQSFQCASLNTTVTSLPTVLAIMPGTPAGAALGAGPFTITAKLSNCSAPPYGGAGIVIGVGTTLTEVFGVSGINFQMVGTPSVNTSGDCPPVTIQQLSSRISAHVTSSVGYSNCTITFTAAGRYYVGTNRIAGTQSVTAVGPRFAYATFSTSCNTVLGCGTFSIGNTQTTGAFSIPVYVAACAGVLNGTQTVQLPKVSTSSFLNNSSPVAKTSFKISLAGCVNSASNGVAGNSGYSAHVTWSFSSCTATNIICNTGTSSVKVQILKSDFSTAISTGSDDIVVLTDGTNVLQYYAAYVNPGGAAATAGSVSATAQLTVTYQ